MNKQITLIIIFIASIWTLNIVAKNDELKKVLLKNSNKFISLCYHALPNKVDLDKYAVDSKSFVNQIEYLKENGYNFIGIKDIIKANKGEKNLPENAILLTFDDAYISQYKNVYKILRLYKIPWVLAVVPHWIDYGPPSDDPKGSYQKPFMTWKDVKEITEDPNVEVACHSYNMHHGVQINPQGSVSPAIISRIYDPKTATYEDDKAYRKRLYDDFKKGYDRLKEKTGTAPRVMVWPYGEYNQASIEEAEKVGFSIFLTLDDGLGNADKLDAIPRYMITDNPSIASFIKGYRKGFKYPERKKIIHADLDLLYDDDQQQMNKNIDEFIQRMYDLKPSTVYLQAFCDSDGDGNASSLYFPNTVLPVKADIFSRVARSLIIRNIEVYAWMPMLSFITPDQEKDKELAVYEGTGADEAKPTTESYKRLSPFNDEACELISQIYRDLAINAYIDGVVFQDDGYLSDNEDFSKDAMDDYLKITGGKKIAFNELPNEMKDKWTDLKTDKLIELTEKLKKAVSYYRPKAFYSRIIYAPVMYELESEEWFAQNYEKCLNSYDYVTVMAYPRMEDVFFTTSWLEKLVATAKKQKNGLNKTVFKVQAYDWKKDKWINSDTVVDWITTLVANGAHNIAYYPDNFFDNQPEKSKIINVISSQDFPFKKSGKK